MAKQVFKLFEDMNYRHGNNIPGNREKKLFAEDAVAWFLGDYFNVIYEPSLGKQYRESKYKGFNNTIKSAMISVYHRLDIELIADPPTQWHHKHFSRRLRNLFFKEGFDPKLFLIYCVYVMAVLRELIMSIGVQTTGDLAARSIVKAFGNHVMLSEGWDRISAIAQRIVNDEDYTDSHSPHEIYLSPENANHLSSSSDQQDLNDEILNGNGVSNNMSEQRIRLEVNQEVDTKTPESIGPSDSMEKQAPFSASKSDDVKDDLGQMKLSKVVGKLGSPSFSSYRESNYTQKKAVKDYVTSEYGDNVRSFQSKQSLKIDNGRLEVIKIESSSLVEESRSGLSQGTNNSFQIGDFKYSVLASEFENNQTHWNKQQSQKQEYKRLDHVPELGLSQNKNKVNIKHVPMGYERPTEFGSNLDQVGKQVLPTRDRFESLEANGSHSVLPEVLNSEYRKEDPFANHVLVSKIKNNKKRLKMRQLQNHDGMVEAPVLRLTQYEDDANMKGISTCSAQSSDVTISPQNPDIQLSSTQNHAVIGVSGFISGSPKFQNKTSVGNGTALERRTCQAEGSKICEKCFGDTSWSQSDKESVEVLSSQTLLQVKYKKYAKKISWVKIFSGIIGRK